MRTLIELNRLIKKQSSLVDLQLPKRNDSPLRKLYHIVDQGLTENDAESMVLIYGKKNVTAFSRLKARLKDVMYQSLLQSNHHEAEGEVPFSDSITLYKNTIVCRVLNNKKAFSLSNELLEKSFEKSIEFGLTDNVLAQLRMLIIYNSSISTDDFKASKYRFKKYFDQLDKYLDAYIWELKAEKYFYDIQKSQSQSFSNVNKDIIEKAFKYYQELKEIHHIDSTDFQYNRYRIHAAFLEFTKDYEGLLDASVQLLSKFKHKNLALNSIEANINTRIIWSNIQAGFFDQADKFGTNVIESISRNSIVWYRNAYYTLKARIYSENYNRACLLLLDIFTSSFYNKLPEYYKELFNTIHGYLSLILLSGYKEIDDKVRSEFPEFKMGKYLNTTLVFSKDKRGSNISILLLFIAYLLKKGDYNSLIDRVDSLSQYAYRYLRRDDSFRSNVFIKMIIQMVKADFNQIRIDRYTSDLSLQLSSVNLAGSGENIEIEVIPFENLWKLMLSFIEKGK